MTQTQKNLIVEHSWTKASEKKALEAVYKIFSEKYPDINIEDLPEFDSVVKVQNDVKSKVEKGTPPDVFQSTYGPGISKALSDYTQSLDEFFEDFPIPQSLKDWGKVEDHYYFLPLNVHRDNNLWYNKKIVKELGLEMPIQSLDDFLDVCSSIDEDTDYIPIAFGIKGEPYWLNYIFEWCIVASSEESDFLPRLFAGGGDKETLEKSLKYYEKLMTNYVNKNYSDLTWDEAGELLLENKAIFNVMGDWQKGFFTDEGWSPGEDFGFQTVPGSEGISIAHGNCFGLCKKAPNFEEAKKFFGVLKSKRAEEEFCIIKSATPPRSDADIKDFDQMQKKIIKLIRNDQILSSSLGYSNDWFSKIGETLEDFAKEKEFDEAVYELNKIFSSSD